MSDNKVRQCKYHGTVNHRQTKSGKVYCPKCSALRVQMRRDKVKKMSVEYKGGKCQRCDYDKCLGAMDFHHTNPDEKDFALSKNGHTRSWERVKKELDKCILVCCRCHREIHEEQFKEKKEQQFAELKKESPEIVKPTERVLKEKTFNECPVCNKMKDSELVTCSIECARKKSRKVNWDEIDLESLFKDHSMVSIGKMFGVSDNSVRKQLKKRKII